MLLRGGAIRSGNMIIHLKGEPYGRPEYAAIVR